MIAKLNAMRLEAIMDDSEFKIINRNGYCQCASPTEGFTRLWLETTDVASLKPEKLACTENPGHWCVTGPSDSESRCRLYIIPAVGSIDEPSADVIFRALPVNVKLPLDCASIMGSHALASGHWHSRRFRVSDAVPLVSETTTCTDTVSGHSGKWMIPVAFIWVFVIVVIAARVACRAPLAV